MEAEKAEQAAAKLAEEALSQMQPTVSQPEQTNVTQGSWGKFIFGGAAIGVVAGVGLYFWRESSNNGSSGGGGK